MRPQRNQTRFLFAWPRWAMAGALLLGGCTDEYNELYESCPEHGDCTFSRAQWETIASLTCLDCDPEHPAGQPVLEPSNELAGNPNAIDLGKRLFHDRQLGSTGDSCATCHDPNDWFTGDQEGEFRGITSALDSAYYPWHAWHGAKDSLWSLALVPMEKGSLLNGHRLAIVHHVAQAYPEIRGMVPSFLAAAEIPACGGSPPRRSGTATHEQCRTAWDDLSEDEKFGVDASFVAVGKALATYMYTLTSGETPFDRYVRGGDDLDPAAKRGLALFIGKANCVSCHSGPTFSDGDFHDIGLRGVDPETTDRLSAVQELRDKPSFSLAGPFAAVQKVEHLESLELHPRLAGAFRTPTLRNVAATPPYMHTAEFVTLQDVIWHYDATTQAQDGTLDANIWPLELDGGEVQDIVAFLRTLTQYECPWADDGCPS